MDSRKRGLKLRGNVWWIRYCRNGKRYEESAATSSEKTARTLLQEREGDAAHGLPVSSKIGQLRFDEAAKDAIRDFKASGKSSLPVFDRRITLHLTPYFGGRRMAEIGTADIRAFTVARQEATYVIRKARVLETETGAVDVPEVRKRVSNAEINRELATLRRIFTIAVQNGKLLHRPYVPMLKESAPRAGFFEADQMAAVLAHLPERRRGAITFAYVTGWRLASEVLPLEWRQVDFAAGEVRLDPGTTKNGEGRVFPMTPALKALLEAEKARTDEDNRRLGKIVPWVFHRKCGKQLHGCTKAFQIACVAAGCPGRIPHDLRRTAVRNLVRAGVAERVAMQMTGHKTRSVFERYNIVSEGDLREAAAKLHAAGAR